MCKFSYGIRFSLIAAVLFFYPLTLSADTVLNTDNTEISFANANGPGSTGSFPAGTFTFNLSAADIPNVQLLTNLSVIDDGFAINVNGQTFFSANELTQFGPMDFVMTDVQPNDIDNSFNTNDNGLSRLIVDASSVGTAFSGAPFQNSTDVVEYLPNFTVTDFTSLLRPGDNTIEFIALNGAQGTNVQGEFQVILQTPAVPEPAIASLMFAGLLMLGRRRQR